VDAVHSHEFTMAVYGAAAARRRGRPHIATQQASQTMTARWRRRAALRWAFRRSSATVAVSHDYRRHLEATLGLAPDAVTVVHNGIPQRPGDRDGTRRRLGIPPEELLLLSVGNLSRRKAHGVLIQALAALRNHAAHPRWRLAIAGDGDERAGLDALRHGTGLADRVLLLGARNDVPDLQAAADIFVLPSLWEGLPLAILEAMFAGNAIVASNVSGIPEAVEHGREGLLTPPGDVGALRDALAQVIGDAGCRTRLGRAALERAQTQFTIKAMTDAYERLYRS
jgi:glycosyltransferase involved in cell wall biosynthesis